VTSGDRQTKGERFGPQLPHANGMGMDMGRFASRERNGKGYGPICLLFSEAGRWYLYDAESDAKRQVRYDSSEQKRKEWRKNKTAFAGDRPTRR
jgi:hypothetical protein